MNECVIQTYFTLITFDMPRAMIPIE